MYKITDVMTLYFSNLQLLLCLTKVGLAQRGFSLFSTSQFLLKQIKEALSSYYLLSKDISIFFLEIKIQQMSSHNQNSDSTNKTVSRQITFKNVPILAQILAGFSSGFLVSPFNTIVDRSVIQNANGKTPLWTGVSNGLKTLFTNPKFFLGSFQFRWLLLVYTSTYISSNLADHINIKNQDPAIVKLLITFMVNTVTSLAKDKALAQKFGITQKRNFPLASYGLFFMRDIIAMASAFTIPPILGLYISERTNIEKKNGLRIAQMISPLIVQLVATPLHLVGLDWYNNPSSSLTERLLFLRKIYTNSLLIRMLRFLPTYGIGGIVNIQIRSYFNKEQNQQ